MSRTKCVKLKKGILGGRMLAIDPTSGSISRITGKPSVAGWAIFDKGKLLSSGIIEIPKSTVKEDRLRDLLEVLQSDFDEDFDVLALEDIPMVRSRGDFSISQTLIQACGVYIAGTKGSLVELNTHTWQAIAKRLGGWTKSDESDAQYIGLAAIAFANGYNQKLSEKKKIEFLGDLVDQYDGWGLPELQNHWRDYVRSN